MRTLGVVLVVVGLLAAGCGQSPSSETAAASTKPAAAPAAVVTTVTPEYRMRHSALETNGKMVFNEETLVRINATVTGRVVEVLVRPGDVVSAGHRLLVHTKPGIGNRQHDIEAGGKRKMP